MRKIELIANLLGIAVVLLYLAMLNPSMYLYARNQLKWVRYYLWYYTTPQWSREVPAYFRFIVKNL